jgi:hypothetical protein
LAAPLPLVFSDAVAVVVVAIEIDAAAATIPHKAALYGHVQVVLAREKLSPPLPARPSSSAFQKPTTLGGAEHRKVL